ncbi:MAG: HIT family protein [Candidatus Micrarchaeia archaeon]
MEECIFCKLDDFNKNSIIYKDDLCFVMIDKYPVEYGHLLVISNKHYENMLKTDDETMMHMYLIAKKFGIKQMEKLGAKGVNITTNIGKDAGQAIMHFHIHIIPRYEREKSIKYNYGHHSEIKPEHKSELISILKE